MLYFRVVVKILKRKKNIKNNAAIGQFGILLNKNSSSALAKVIPHNNRILVNHFNGNLATTSIAHYAPIKGDNEATDHYEQLTNITRTIPNQDVFLVIGDCNAHFCPEDTLYIFQEKANNNGELVLDYSQEADLMIASSIFQKKWGKLFHK